MRSADTPARAALTLKELQSVFQDAILNGDEKVLSLILDNSRTSRSTLFGVYQNAYASRLAEILAADYEALHTYLGDDDFDELARAYIALHPSRSQNARWFGSHMPAYLRGDPNFAEHAEVADLAELEKVLADAFDAADAMPVSVTDLAGFAPEDWGRLIFKPHPSAAVLKAQTDVFSLWKALQDSTPLPDMTAPAAPRQLIIWRQGATPMVREIGDEEAMMWTEAAHGVRFDALCEMVAVFDNPDEAAMRAASYLQGWLTTGMLASARLAPEKPTKP